MTLLENYVTPEQAAKNMVPVSAETIRRAIRRGELKAVRIGTICAVSIVDLKRWNTLRPAFVRFRRKRSHAKQ